MSKYLRKRKSEPESSAPLDLGLSSLITGENAEVCRAPLINDAQLPTKESTPLAFTLGLDALGIKETKSEDLSQFKILAQEERWSELSRLTESKLSGESSQDFEARLWWVKSQLSLRAVPSSILAAPLDSSSAALIEAKRQGNGMSSESEHLAQSLLQEIGEILRKSGDSELAKIFDERRALLSQNGNLKNAVAAEARQAAKSGKNESSSFVAQKKNLYRAGLAALLIALSFLWFFKGPHVPREGGTADAGQSENFTLSIPSPLLPSIDQKQGLSHLSALYYDIENSRTKKTDNSKPSVAAQPKAEVSAPVVDSSTQTKDDKQVVDTSGPKESADIRALEGQRDSVVQENEIDFPPFRKKPAETGSSNGADNAQSRGMERFEPPKVFTIITPTRVMSRPSYWGAPVDSLDTGDEINVDARIGSWLQLHSKNGRIGYILAQDAEDGSIKPSERRRVR